MSGADPVDVLADLFAGPGTQDYFGEPVSQAEHMLQTAALARAAGASDALVAAALLHDIGHFHGEHTGQDLLDGTDNRHGDTGAVALARWFGPAVTEPVRLHVDAKRYLCAVEPEYFARLSPASRRTLEVQGGPMASDELARFRDHAYHADAVTLRRWDDLAKQAAVETPSFDRYRGLLRGLLVPG